MISSLQPHRPRIPAPSHAPLNQQPTRPLSTISSPTARPPRTQLEAMPPSTPQLPLNQRVSEVAYDAAVRHPVFFTRRLMRAPHGVGSGNGDGTGKGWGSPVTVGYVFNDGVKREGDSRL